MTYSGSILVAHHDHSLSELACGFLRQAGHDCQRAPDAEKAQELFKTNYFDLMLTDYTMPNVPDLHLVRVAHDADPEMAVIVVTNNPTVESAMQSMKFSVMAYLAAPVDWAELGMHIQNAIERSRRRRALSSVAEQLQTALDDIGRIRSLPLPSGTALDNVPISVVRTIATSLSELLQLSAFTDPSWGRRNLCEVLDCPQKPLHRQAIVESIEVLKNTKEAFKSKQLAMLRKKLELLLSH